MRVILEPLIGDAPLVGGITFFFIRRPVSASIHFNPHQLRSVIKNKIGFNIHVYSLIFFFLDPSNQLDWCNQPFGQPCLQVNPQKKKLNFSILSAF